MKKLLLFTIIVSTIFTGCKKDTHSIEDAHSIEQIIPKTYYYMTAPFNSIYKTVTADENDPYSLHPTFEATTSTVDSATVYQSIYYKSDDDCYIRIWLRFNDLKSNMIAGTQQDYLYDSYDKYCNMFQTGNWEFSKNTYSLVRSVRIDTYFRFNGSMWYYYSDKGNNTAYKNFWLNIESLEKYTYSNSIQGVRVKGSFHCTLYHNSNDSIVMNNVKFYGFFKYK